LPSAPPSSFISRKTTTEVVSWAGHLRAGVLGRLDGPRPGKFFTPFFLFFSFSFISCLLFWIC
jgi:hypothetical protein